MNRIVLTGHIVNEPVFKLGNSSNISIITLTLASRRNFKNKEGNYESDFLNLVAYRNTADFINKYFKKGDMICVEGRVQVRNYDDKDGNKRYVTEIVVESAEFVGAKKDSSTNELTEEVKIPQNYKSNYEGTNDLSIQLNDDDIDKVFDNSLPF